MNLEEIQVKLIRPEPQKFEPRDLGLSRWCDSRKLPSSLSRMDEKDRERLRSLPNGTRIGHKFQGNHNIMPVGYACIANGAILLNELLVSPSKSARVIKRQETGKWHEIAGWRFLSYWDLEKEDWMKLDTLREVS